MDYLEKIKYILSHPLPGEEAHEKIMSYNRAQAVDARMMEPHPKESAVMMLLFPYREELCTLFIVRPENQGVHSGQMSFPGGKKEHGESMLETALRETEEEIGLASNQIEIIGELTEIYIPPSHFLVQPYIGVLSELPELTPSPDEVSKILIEPVSNLMTAPTILKKKIFIPKFERTLEVPYFDVQGHTLWGATAMMVYELKFAIEKANI